MAVPATACGNRLPRYRPRDGVTHTFSEGILMSILAIAQSASVTPAHVNFSNSGHKKGLAGDALGDSGAIGQLPVGAGQNLFSNALQSLQQAVSAQASAAPSAAIVSTGAAGAAAATGVEATAAAPGPLGNHIDARA
jgi:hypothetical protein